MVKLGKTQYKKTLTKHSETSQDSQSKCSKCRPLAFTQVCSRTRHSSMALSMTDCCIPDHTAIRRRFRSSTLRIGVWYTQSCMIPQTSSSTGKFIGNITAKNYPNRPRINKVIAKMKKVQFFWNTVYSLNQTISRRTAIPTSNPSKIASSTT